MKNTRLKYKLMILILCFLLIFLILFILYQTVYLDYKSNIEFEILGNNEITLDVFDTYKEEGTMAIFRDIDITNKVKVKGNVDTSKVGEYELTYTVKYKNKKATLKRKVNVVDKQPPEISLKGESSYSIYLGDDFIDPGVVALDNYDGDITNNVKIDNLLDINKVGTYTITYTIIDSSGNTSSITRKVEVKEKPTYSQGIAVLNYHFFYSDGESCGQAICLNTKKFEEQLKYLKDNGYTTLSMSEFVSFMYGEIEVPKKSVLLTIDDGALGTGKHNGNKLIPLLEKYQVHATLFLITGWWSIDNYQSEYLDIESHTYDMHREGLCQGVTRGAQLLCSTHEQALLDMRKSIEITGSNKAFCYPFYAYNNDVIEIVKEAGFKVAFAGGNSKATKNSNKYAIPRYPIYDSTSLKTFVSYIS